MVTANKQAPTTLPDDDFDVEPIDLNKGPSSTPVNIPPPEEFGSNEFMESAMLRSVVRRVIDQNTTDLGHLTNVEMVILWKKEGGKTKGKNKLAEVIKPSGLLYYALDAAHFVIWIAADHCQKMTRAELERLIFRHLLRMQYDSNGASLKDYDFHLFAAEVRKYGTKAQDVIGVVKELRQLGFEEAEVPDPPEVWKNKEPA